MGSKNCVGQGRRSNVKHFPQNVVTSPLAPPLSFTADDSGTYGMEIIASNSANVGTKSIAVHDSSGNQLWGIPEAGGPFSVGYDIQVYHSTSGSCMALRGAESPPCFVFPDNSKMWMGSASPIIGTTVGLTPVAGDKYLCRSSAFLVASSYNTLANVSATRAHVGGAAPTNATAIVPGTPAAGDLLLAAVAGTNVTRTFTIGGTAGIPNDLTVSDGTETVWLYSKVLVAGDISGGQVQAFASSNITGTGRLTSLMVFRHPNSWATTGSLNQAILSASVTATGSSTSLTLNPTGTLTAPAVAAGICYQSTAPTSPGMLFQWGSGIGNSQWTNSQYADAPTIGANTNQASSSCKPGTGNNISGQTTLPHGAVSLGITGLGGNQAALMGAYQVNGSTNPILYMYTGSAWTQVI